MGDVISGRATNRTQQKLGQAWIELKEEEVQTENQDVHKESNFFSFDMPLGSASPPDEPAEPEDDFKEILFPRLLLLDHIEQVSGS